MCGIFAAYLPEGGFLAGDLLPRAAQCMVRRGPDAEGYFLSSRAVLAHRRLSIIDVSGGNQPLSNEDGSVVVVFNGEIYNFRTLRSSLAGRGHRFRTQSDTEVLVHLYEEYGEDMAQRLNGAFAFALYDVRKGSMIFCRDRFGIKPLYERRIPGGVAFASSVEALKVLGPTTVDLEAVDDFLTYGYVPGERSIWQEIREVPPGVVGRVEACGMRAKRYWNPVGGCERLPVRRWLDRFRDILADAVRLRLVSDVPLGAFLSGGIDSSTVVAFMSRFGPVETFTVGFPGEEEEVRAARRVLDRYCCRSHFRSLRSLREEDVLDAVRAMEEPFADHSMVPTFLVCRSGAGSVKVALSGDGADELFAGYPWLRTSVRQFAKPRWTRYALGGLGGVCRRIFSPGPRDSTVVGRFCRYAGDGRKSLIEAFLRRRSIFAPELKAFAYSGDFGAFAAAREGPFLHRVAEGVTGRPEDLLELDFRYYLSGDILTKVDRLSMYNSLEVRVPFLDHRLVEHVLRTDPHLRYQGRPKALLKKAVKDLLPPELLRRRKRGFGLPLRRYFTGAFLRSMTQWILDGPAVREGLFDRAKLRYLLRQERSQRADWSNQLWAVAMLNLWWEEVAEKNRPQGAFYVLAGGSDSGKLEAKGRLRDVFHGEGSGLTVR